ncbi:DUF3106 domain-containing protein [Comamonas sp. GB3 AK4-5]|uniref:DUF3106 domain-containing protein n=1 Tax=Comamonas sp. GB3 AK4-5 TaxID=3231487 RepID=UPI00351E6ADF
MHTRAPSAATSPSLRAATTVAVAVLLGLAIGGGWAVSQARMAPSAVPADLSVPGPAGTPHSSLAASTHQELQRSNSGPQWRELSKPQQRVLEPLQERWSNMAELTKRRWMSLADGFDQLQPEDQEKLHRRMQTWASLSAQQRNQARLNFFASRQLSSEELQAKWDAYQALSDEEKRRLAAKAAPKSHGAATALRVPAKRKLATIPAANAPSANVANPPKIPPHPPAALPHPFPDAPVQTAPVVTPQAAPVINLPPLGDNAPVQQTETPQSGAVYSPHPDFPPIHSPQ